MIESYDVMTRSPVIPVLVIDDVHQAQPIAEALVRGGLTVLEVTLRTPAALDVLREMSQVEGALVGAGTVVDEAGLNAALDCGAQFIVSPGLTETVARPAIASGIAFLPGVANATDIMRGMDLGLRHFKFFPAEAAGGIKALRALAAPFSRARFCPTGGVTAASAPAWLAEPSVLCVGGSWIVPSDVPNLQLIRSTAGAAAALRDAARSSCDEQDG